MFPLRRGRMRGYNVKDLIVPVVLPGKDRLPSWTTTRGRGKNERSTRWNSNLPPTLWEIVVSTLFFTGSRFINLGNRRSEITRRAKRPPMIPITQSDNFFRLLIEELPCYPQYFLVPLFIIALLQHKRYVLQHGAQFPKKDCLVKEILLLLDEQTLTRNGHRQSYLPNRSEGVCSLGRTFDTKKGKKMKCPACGNVLATVTAGNITVDAI
jgi:hypothetical protein